MMRYLKLFSEAHTQPAISFSHGDHLNFFLSLRYAIFSSDNFHVIIDNYFGKCFSDISAQEVKNAGEKALSSGSSK